MPPATSSPSGSARPPASSRLRIVILTGYEPDPVAAQRAGGDAILGKPFRLHEFLEVVNRLLETTAA